MPSCGSVAGDWRVKVVANGKLRAHEVVVVQIIRIEEADGAMAILICQMNAERGGKLADLKREGDKAIHGGTGRSPGRIQAIKILVRLGPIRRKVLSADRAGVISSNICSRSRREVGEAPCALVVNGCR